MYPAALVGAGNMGIPSHFMISESDGALYDCRAENWAAKPLRRDYSRHFAAIETVAQFKATLRAGGYTWPGGYSLAFICHDGGALCFDCARAEARNVMDSIATDCRDGWRVVGCHDVDNADSATACDHCGEHIGGEDYAD